MHGKSRVSSAIKYDCFKLDDSGNCIIAVFVCSILMNTMLKFSNE